MAMSKEGKAASAATRTANRNVTRQKKGLPPVKTPAPATKAEAIGNQVAGLAPGRHTEQNVIPTVSQEEENAAILKGLGYTGSDKGKGKGKGKKTQAEPTLPPVSKQPKDTLFISGAEMAPKIPGAVPNVFDPSGQSVLKRFKVKHPVTGRPMPMDIALNKSQFKFSGGGFTYEPKPGEAIPVNGVLRTVPQPIPESEIRVTGTPEEPRITRRKPVKKAYNVGGGKPVDTSKLEWFDPITEAQNKERGERDAKRSAEFEAKYGKDYDPSKEPGFLKTPSGGFQGTPAPYVAPEKQKLRDPNAAPIPSGKDTLETRVMDPEELKSYNLNRLMSKMRPGDTKYPEGVQVGPLTQAGTFGRIGPVMGTGAFTKADNDRRAAEAEAHNAIQERLASDKKVAQGRAYINAQKRAENLATMRAQKAAPAAE